MTQSNDYYLPSTFFVGFVACFAFGSAAVNPILSHY